MTDSPLSTQAESCQITNCGKTIGLWRPVIKVWAKGYAKGSHPPLLICSAVSLCYEHVNLFDINTMPDWRQLVEEHLKKDPYAYGEPDFKTAEVVMLPMIVI